MAIANCFSSILGENRRLPSGAVSALTNARWATPEYPENKI
jgi:hypothetical protein